MTLFTQFPGQASDAIENVSETASMRPDASNLPPDDLGHDLAAGESVLGDSPQVASLRDALASPPLDLIDIAVRAAMPLQFSFGQADTPLASFGALATGMSAQPDITVSVIEISNYSSDCACPICGGGSDAATPATWDAAAPNNPPTHGTITQLADYLRVTYWDDRGDRDPRQFNMGVTGNNGELRYDLTGWTGSLSTDNGSSFSDTNGISSTAIRDLIRDAFDWYEQVLGINFVEVNAGSDPAAGTVDFFFTDADTGSFFNSTETFGGNGGNINYNVINIAPSTANNSLYSTILHEIGHGLGLGHQGNYNNSASFATQAIYRNDSYQLSNMSYFSVATNPFVEGSSVRGVTMQTADLHALNQIYASQGFGPYARAFTGDTVYGVNTTVTAAESRILNQLTTHAATNLFTIVDAGGVDKVDFSNFSANQNINLTVITSGSTTGSVSSVGGLTDNMFIAVGTIIENATAGSGNDTLTGNQYANHLIGNAGNDILYGGAGIDSLAGNDGNDTIYGGTSGDTIKGGGGADLIHAEDGNDYSKGGAGNDTIYAGSGIDTIQGDAGNDRIVVTSAATLAAAGFYGGTETDTFVVDGAGTYDLRNSTLTGFEELEFDADGANVVKNIHITGAQAVGLLAGARIDGSNNDGAHDRLYIHLGGTTTLDMSGWIMQDWVQTAAQTDFLGVYGGAAAETVTGTGFNDYMELGGGNDVAYGGNGLDSLKGGAGNDTLYGGAGNDNLQGGSNNDRLYAGGGIDTLYGDDGSDYLYGSETASTSVFYGGLGSDTFYKASATTAGNSEGWYGGDDSDWLIWTNATVFSTRVVNLATGFITSAGSNRDVVQGIENVLLENGAGIIGDANANWLQATGTFNNSIDGGAGNDTIKGGAGNDVLRGGTGIDHIQGEDGDDTLYDGNSTEGADSLYGGLGNDTLVKESNTSSSSLKVWDGGDGIDTFDYSVGAGVGRTVDLAMGRIAIGASLRDFLSNIENVTVRDNQTIIGDSANNVLTAVGLFNNSIDGGGGNDTIDGGDGNDTLYGGLGDDNLIGGTGNDGMEGGDGTDYMTGNAGSDTMLGQAGSDTLIGGDDNDFVYGGDDNDWLYGGNGNDLLSGELGNDSIQADDGNDTAYGGEGDDTLDGWSGDDVLYGDSGADAIFGHIGNDTLYGGAGIDTLSGEDGDDSMVSGAGEGLDNFYGGLGTDTLDLSALKQNHAVNLAAGTYSVGAQTRDIASIEVLLMGGGKDTVTGSADAETIHGGGKADRIFGGGGGDILHGDAGADLLHAGIGTLELHGGVGADTMTVDAGFASVLLANGGDGRDTIDLSAVAGAVTVDLAAGTVAGAGFSVTLVDVEDATGGAGADLMAGSAANNRLRGGDGDDTLQGLDGNDVLSGEAGHDVVEGGNGNDNLSGNGGLDTLYGGAGNDTLSGDTFADMLFGDGGNDSLDGGAGADTLTGGLGRDTLIGGDGADTFRFFSNNEIGTGANSDQILDFLSGSDKIDLSGHVASFTFIGTSAFSGTAGELRYFNLGGVGYLAGDTSGNMVANFELILLNGATVAAGDLIL